MNVKIICNEEWCGICNLFPKSNLEIDRIKNIFILGNINPMDGLSGITTTKGCNFINEDNYDFS